MARLQVKSNILRKIITLVILPIFILFMIFIYPNPAYAFRTSVDAYCQGRSAECAAFSSELGIKQAIFTKGATSNTLRNATTQLINATGQPVSTVTKSYQAANGVGAFVGKGSLAVGGAFTLGYFTTESITNLKNKAFENYCNANPSEAKCNQTVLGTPGVWRYTWNVSPGIAWVGGYSNEALSQQFSTKSGCGNYSYINSDIRGLIVDDFTCNAFTNTPSFTFFSTENIPAESTATPPSYLDELSDTQRAEAVDSLTTEDYLNEAENNQTTVDYPQVPSNTNVEEVTEIKLDLGTGTDTSNLIVTETEKEKINEPKVFAFGDSNTNTDNDSNTDGSTDTGTDTNTDTNTNTNTDTPVIPETQPIQAQDFSNTKNWLQHGIDVFSNKFPFDIFGDFTPDGTGTECPTYSFFDYPFELCPVKDFFSIMKVPVIIGFLIWSFMQI